MKRNISILLCFIFCLLSISNAAATGFPRNITGEYSGIELLVNNIKIPLYREPFVYEGEVYLPINNLSERLYLTSSYDKARNTVRINTGGILQDTTTRTFAGSLLQKDYEIQAINKELLARDEKIEDKIGIPYKKINTVEEMEAYIQEHFKKLHNIPMTFDFRHASGYRYRLYITFPSRDRDDFEYLSRRVIEEWLDDIYYAIRYLYDDRARIDGHVRDNASSYRTYLSFESSGDYLDLSFRSYSSSSNRVIDISERNLERRLERDLSSYSGISFEYEVNANRYDIDLIVYFKDKDFYDWSSTTQRNFLNRLERVLRNYDNRLDAYGKIIDSKKDEEVVRFHFIDSRVDYYDYEPKPTTSTRPIIIETEQNPVVERSLTAWFNQIGLEVDGLPFTMLKEPFMIDDEIYMPISDLADSLYWVFEYIPDENTLKIFDNNFDSKNYLAFGGSLLNSREQEIEKLLLELEIKKEEFDRERTTYLPYRNILSLSRMQTYLRDYFEDFEGLDMSISFSRSSGNRYRLRISYDRDDFEDFDDIRRATIESWVDDMYQAVLDLYDEKAEISGYIRDDSSGNLTYIDFDTNRYGRLTFDFVDHGNQSSSPQRVDSRDLERALDRYLGRVRGVNFRYEVELNRRDVDLNIYCTNNYFTRWDIHDKINYLQDLKEEIADVYDNISINGKIHDTGRKDEIFSFSIERGNIRSYDLMEDLEKYLEKNYGRFYYADNSFNFTYRLWEKDSSTFDIKLEGDFFANDRSWQSVIGGGDDNAGYQAFETYVNDSLKYVSDFFKVDILGEAVDKSYSSLLVKTIKH